MVKQETKLAQEIEVRTKAVRHDELIDHRMSAATSRTCTDAKSAFGFREVRHPEPGKHFKAPGSDW